MGAPRFATGPPADASTSNAPRGVGRTWVAMPQPAARSEAAASSEVRIAEDHIPGGALGPGELLFQHLAHRVPGQVVDVIGDLAAKESGTPGQTLSGSVPGCSPRSRLTFLFVPWCCRIHTDEMRGRI